MFGRTCPRCSVLAPLHARFCPRCGLAAGAAAAPAPSPARANAAAPAHPRRATAGFLFFILALAVGLAGAFVFSFVASDRRPDAPAQVAPRFVPTFVPPPAPRSPFVTNPIPSRATVRLVTERYTEVFPESARRTPVTHSGAELNVRLHSTLRLHGVASEPLSGGHLRVEPTGRVAFLTPQPSDPARFSVDIPIDSPRIAGLLLTLKDRAGRAAAPLSLRPVRVVVGPPPAIRIAVPAHDSPETILPQGKLQVGYEADDGADLRSLVLRYVVIPPGPAAANNAPRVVRTMQPPLSTAPGPRLRGLFTLDLARLGEPTPEGTRIEWWLEAPDAPVPTESPHRTTTVVATR